MTKLSTLEVVEKLYPVTPELLGSIMFIEEKSAAQALLRASHEGKIARLKSRNAYIPNWLAEKYPESVDKAQQ